jgi:ribose 5-phosphate isomerase B
MKIYLATDHAGFALKEKIKLFLTSLHHEVVDLGAAQFDENDDYPDFIKPAAHAVAGEMNSLGIIFGGNGQGEAITANKVPGIRAAVFYGEMIPVGVIDSSGTESKDPYEMVKLSRFHDDANILSIGARFVTEEQAEKAVKVFIDTLFSGEERHNRRIAKIEL